MPTKITPLPKPGGGGGAGGGGGGGGKTSTKTSNIKAVRKSKFFTASHFTAATASLSVVTQNKGYLHAIIFTSCVGLGLLILGSVFVHIGDEEYIVDVMVLGGLCIVMGVGSLVVGCIFILRPVFKEKRRQKTEKGPVRSALPPDPTPDSYFNPTFLMEDLPGPGDPNHSASVSVSGNTLYDRESLGATREAPRGRLVPPSPPAVAQPTWNPDGRVTAATILTTVAAESDEVSELSNDVQSLHRR